MSEEAMKMLAAGLAIGLGAIGPGIGVGILGKGARLR
jgi:F-type H+-transporting ATPase subunit c